MLPRFHAACFAADRTASAPRALLTRLLAAFVLTAGLSGQVAADSGTRQTLGYGHFFDNDVFGDGYDRWNSGAYTFSVLRGPSWEDHLPARPFEVLEYRVGGAIVAPSKLRNPPPGDRQYVGKVSASLHTHFAPRPGMEAALGLGFVWTGPSNGVSDFQKWLHRVFSAPRPVVAADQFPNHLYPVFIGEIARPVALGGAELRPFLEARAGDESFVRIGADLAFGARERGALWLRDEVTGQRYVGIAGQDAGRTSFVVGADIAHVFDSVYFPTDAGTDFTPTRKRVRLGIDTHLGDLGVFYGATWLSEEFEGQPEGQVIGSLRFRKTF